MPQFDYNIANSLRPIQLESPMNQLAQAYQIKGAQQNMQMNALSMQEKERAAAEDEQIRLISAKKGVDYTSPEYLNQVMAISPKRGMALAKEGHAMRGEAAKARKEAADALDKELGTFRSFAPQVNSEESVAQYVKAMYGHPFIGELARSTVPFEQSLENNLKAFRENPDQWRINASGITGDKILDSTLKIQKQREEQKRREYSDYVYQTLDQGGEPVPFAQFAAPAPAAPAPAPAPAAPTSATPSAPVEGGALPIGDGGEKILPAMPVTTKAVGIPGINPYAAMLYRTGDPRDKDMADKIQAAYAEDKKIPTDIKELKAYMAMTPTEKRAFEKLQKLRGTNISVNDNAKVAHTTTDNAGNVTFYNAYGKVISTHDKAGKPSATFEKTQAQSKQMQNDLTLAISELEKATKPGGLIDQSTGSGIGRVADVAARFVGKANTGDIAIGKLQIIADLPLKMIPRFEGPQSDKDTQSYKEAAAQVADPTLPREVRKAAAIELLRIMKARKNQFITRDMASGDVGAPSESSVRSQADAILNGGQ